VALDEVAVSAADPAPGAGRLVTGSEESSELASSLALLLPASWYGERWEEIESSVPRFPTDTAGRFLPVLAAMALLSSLRSTGTHPSTK
jgi:hypothetical protein